MGFATFIQTRTDDPTVIDAALTIERIITGEDGIIDRQLARRCFQYATEYSDNQYASYLRSVVYGL